jgi:hypothetical protein
LTTKQPRAPALRLHLVRTMRVLCLVVFAACVPGSIDGTSTPSGGGSGGGGNAGPDAGTTPADTSVPADAAGFTCRNKVASVGSGHHNAGQDCQQGCHNHGFTLSGTLFTTSAGGTPVVGASITVKDAANQTFDMVSQANGNFYTSNVVTFPVTVIASMCPDIKPMAGSISAGNGGCNKSGCHASGAQGPIHLP